MPNTRQMEPLGRTPDVQAREAGFDGHLGREALERLASTELQGVVEAPRLLSASGLWVMLLAREPYSHARILVGIRSRARLDARSTELVLEAAGRSRGMHHPLVISVQGFGSTDQLLWITMRERRGSLLSRWFGADAGRRHAHSAAIELLRHVSPPLQAMHQAGLVHGALSTSSFHRDQQGVVRVLRPGVDVPIVRADLAAGARTEATDCAAPEVRAGREPTPASDQYAVATMIVRLLSGGAPASTGPGRMDEAPERWRPTLKRALSADPQARFPSIAALCQAMDPDLMVRAATESTDESRRSPPGRSGYVPSAFRARRSTSKRLERDGTRSPPVDGGQMLFPGEPWDDELWNLGDGGPRRSMAVRRFAGVVVLLLLFVGIVMYRAGRLEGLRQELGRLGLVSSPSLRPAVASEGGSHLAGRDAGDQDAGLGADVEPPAAVPEPVSPPAATEPINAPGVSDETATTEATVSADVGDDGAAPEAPTSEPTEPVAAEPSATPPAEPRAEATPPPRENPIRAAPPAPGSLSLQSYPWGAVYVDGDFVGTTPLVDLEVPAGPHLIRIARAEYAPYTEDVVVQPGRSLRLTGIILRQEGR